MIKRNFSVIDLLGVVAAITCMLHCIFASVAIALLPYYGGKIWGSELAHQAFAGISIFLCFIAINQGYRKNKDPIVLLFFMLGLLSLGSVAFILPESLHERFEIYLICLGGSFMVIGHMRNIRQLSQCCERKLS